MSGRESKKYSSLKMFIKRLLYLVYMGILLYFVFFSDMFDRSTAQYYRYNLQLFGPMRQLIANPAVAKNFSFSLNFFGNILAFMPFGFLLPLIFTKKKVIFCEVFFWSFFLSAVIESVQLFMKIGTCDVDDVVLNTLGGIIGYAIFKLYWLIRY